MKRPGDEMVGEPLELSMVDGPEQGKGGQMDAYERLLGDAMEGDATLFARQDIVEAAWAIVDPLISETCHLHEYGARQLGPPRGRTPRRWNRRLEYRSDCSVFEDRTERRLVWAGHPRVATVARLQYGKFSQQRESTCQGGKNRP